MFLFNNMNKNSNTEEELKNINKAIEILQENFDKKIISSEYYIAKNQEFLAKKEKLEKKLMQENNK